MFKGGVGNWWLPAPQAGVKDGLTLTLKAVTVREEGIEP